MAELHDVMAYILKHYPPHMAHEMSNARLTKMIYLSDWHQALHFQRQISPINWYFDNFGPFVKDVESTAILREDIFVIDHGSNMYGQSKKTFALRHPSYHPNVNVEEMSSMNHIISIASKLYWAPFINLVYSTHPVASSARYTYLNLLTKAREYQSLKPPTDIFQ